MSTQPILNRQRIQSIDLLRGMVMMIMALDHTRDFFSNARFEPLDLSQTTPPLFLTRFITHYCAPVFIFLSGISIYLGLSKGKTKREQSFFLLTRGLWLIVMEFTIVNWGWSFAPGFSFTMLQVIWAIGWSMIVLAGLIYLPPLVVGLMGLVLIAGHNTLDVIHAEDWGHYSWFWYILHEQGRIAPAAHITMFTMYPLIPWIGVMAAGYWCGTLYQSDALLRRKILYRVGTGSILLFLLLRWINVYGDPLPHAVYGEYWKTAFSFINVNKYPPSLDYLLITLGPALLILAAIDNVQVKASHPALVFGRVPFFYYILHVPLIHAGVYIVGFILGIQQEQDWKGFDLPVVYLVWLLAVSILYLPCRWFMQVKMKHKSWWLSYV
jgi:uncharacterized membrane protein